MIIIGFAGRADVELSKSRGAIFPLIETERERADSMDLYDHQWVAVNGLKPGRPQSQKLRLTKMQKSDQRLAIQ